jgi:hypothetical protein
MDAAETVTCRALSPMSGFLLDTILFFTPDLQYLPAAATPYSLMICDIAMATL